MYSEYAGRLGMLQSMRTWRRVARVCMVRMSVVGMGVVRVCMVRVCMVRVCMVRVCVGAYKQMLTCVIFWSARSAISVGERRGSRPPTPNWP